MGGQLGHGTHDCPETVAAELLVDFGVVVAVVEGVVAAVVVGVEAAAEGDELAVDVEPVEDWPDTVDAGAVVVAGAAVVVVVWAVPDEWAVPPEATTTPRPTAAADAATPMPTVVRRTRAMARSRARAAVWVEGLCSEGWVAMADLSGLGRAPVRGSAVRCSMRPSHRVGS